MTEGMAERTLVPVPVIRQVVGETLLEEAGRCERAALRRDLRGMGESRRACEALRAVCERLGVGRPVTHGTEYVEWED